MPCVAWGSLRWWQVSCGISGNFAVECAATLLWNQWQVLRGIGGNFRMERVATFARNTQKGVSPFQLQQWLGHANLNTTQIYVHLGKQNAKKIMEQTSL